MACQMAYYGHKLIGWYFDGVTEPSAGIDGQFDLLEYFRMRYYKFVICACLCGSFRSNGSTSLVLTYRLFNFEAEQVMKTEGKESSI